MTANERRDEIIKILNAEEQPVAAKALAAKFGVSRQVIVQDLAVIRAATTGIASTSRGYVMLRRSRCFEREFKVHHNEDKTAEEMNIIVDCGGRLRNVSISHRIYGRITAELDIRSRQDVEDFVKDIKNSKSTLLGSVTSGYHYHLIEADNEERLQLIEERLKLAGFIAPRQSWENAEDGI